MQSWPELPIAAWRDTYATLLLYSQIVGKIRLELTPKQNQWWNVPFYLTARGLSTSPMPFGDRTFSIDFDFIDHQLQIDDSDGNRRSVALVSRSVRDFQAALFAELGAIGVELEIYQAPQECPVTTPLDQDTEHATYDAARARDFWEALRRVDVVFKTFRARFRGKSSPVHFFWGAFDLAVSRFNGRRAPRRKSYIDRDAYDEEVISLGFWPGDPWTGAIDALFYSYTVPEPAGLSNRSVEPAGASFDTNLKEFVLPYETVRRAADPARMLLEFGQSTYDTGAKLAGWDRAALAYP